MSSELEDYRQRVEQLENYLIECVGMFDSFNTRRIHETGKAPSSLKGCIKECLADIEKSRSEKDYVTGAEGAYKDCMNLLNMIADNTEEHLPGNNKALLMATAYRQLAEGVHTRMHLFKEKHGTV